MQWDISPISPNWQFHVLEKNVRYYYLPSLTVLQYGDWEVIRRIAGEPEAEIFVCIVRDNHLFTDLLQLGHPAGGQVTVL